MERDHDGAYKLLFSQPRLVADLLSGFVREPWLERADLGTLEKVSPTYVGDDLRHREDDLVWRLRWGGDRWLYVYLILEFQSRVDPFMAVRVLTYVGLLYQDLIRRRELAPGRMLPPVLPLVLYNGERRWRASREVGSLVARVPGGLAEYRPRLRHLVLEEQALPVQAPGAAPNLAAALFELERCRSVDEIQPILARLLEWLPPPDERELRRAFAVWLKRSLLPAWVPAVHLPEVEDLEEVKTMLERNMIEWNQRMRREGRREGEARLLIRLLESRFGELSNETRRRVEAAQSRQLLTWGERVIEAQRLEDVFVS